VFMGLKGMPGLSPLLVRPSDFDLLRGQPGEFPPPGAMEALLVSYDPGEVPSSAVTSSS
jgi:hypothetical protein